MKPFAALHLGASSVNMKRFERLSLILKDTGMTEHLAPGTQDRVATILGWAIFVTFFILFFNIINLPRTPAGAA